MITLKEERAVVRAYMKDPEAAERWFAYYSGTEPRELNEVRASLEAAYAHLKAREEQRAS